MDRLTVTLKTVTPMFLGGANPNQTAEFRAPSIKGALRFWYRAIDPLYKQPFDGKKNSPTWEEKIFGSTEHGQGAFSLRLENGSIKGSDEWNHNNYPNKNGLRYFSFPLDMGGKKRKYIPSNTNICMSTIFHYKPADKERKAILSSLWLLGHIGGLGSRSRRGHGTVALQSWENCQWDECKGLKIAHNAISVDDWWKIFNKGLNILRTWFPEKSSEDHSVFGRNTRFFLFEDSGKNWQEGLDKAGLVMQKFRQRWKIKDTSSDYYKVMEHLAFHEPASIKKGSTIAPCPLNKSPERTAFGLPLTFRYNNSLDRIPKKNHYDKVIIDKKTEKLKMEAPNTTFEGGTHDRSASPIHIRIVKIGAKYHPLYIMLDSALLGNNEKLKDKYGTGYNKPTGKILDTFWNELKKNNNGKEALWK
jgi:CRISPR-associated protein Cmr1